MKIHLISMAFIALVACPARADWPTTLDSNVVICNAPGTQAQPVAVTDGAGGAIVAWRDGRSGQNEVYVARVSATGIPLGPPNGVRLNAPMHVHNGDAVEIASDGAGGAFVGWLDNDQATGRTRMRVQRVDAALNPLWVAGGQATSTVVLNHRLGRLAADGAGGVYAFWAESRKQLASRTPLYGQHFDAAGAKLWGANGDSLSSDVGQKFKLVVASDGLGGAVFAWYDGSQDLVRVQRVAAGGGLLFGAGVAVTSATLNNIGSDIAISSDGAGGAYVATDDANAPGEITLQYVNAAGARPWGAAPAALTGNANTKTNLTLARDASSGVYVGYQEALSPSARELRMRHFSNGGVAQFGVDPLPVYAWSTNTILVSGAFTDVHGGLIALSQFDSLPFGLGASRITAGGQELWPQDLARFASTGLGSAGFSFVATSDGGGIVVWSNSNADVVAKRLYANGAIATVGAPGFAAPRPLALSIAGAQPLRGAGALRLDLPTASRVRVELFGVRGERLASLLDGWREAGAHTIGIPARAMPTGVAFARVTTATGTASLKLVRTE